MEPSSQAIRSPGKAPPRPGAEPGTVAFDCKSGRRPEQARTDLLGPHDEHLRVIASEPLRADSAGSAVARDTYLCESALEEAALDGVVCACDRRLVCARGVGVAVEAPQQVRADGVE